MYLIVGLGNPGSKYENNRHNVGFMAIDLIAEKLGVSVNKLKFKGLYGQANYKGEKLILLKPQTFMNSSGESVSQFFNYYKIEPEKLIVLVDDIDIEFGRVRIRKKGSAGTHNGLKSIVNLLGTSDFPRIKIAVGKNPSYMDLVNFVLGNFSKEEKKIIDKEIELASQAVFDLVDKDLDYAMNRINPIKID